MANTYCTRSNDSNEKSNECSGRGYMLEIFEIPLFMELSI